MKVERIHELRDHALFKESARKSNSEQLVIYDEAVIFQREKEKEQPFENGSEQDNSPLETAHPEKRENRSDSHKGLSITA